MPPPYGFPQQGPVRTTRVVPRATPLRGVLTRRDASHDAPTQPGYAPYGLPPGMPPPFRPPHLAPSVVTVRACRALRRLRSRLPCARFR